MSQLTKARQKLEVQCCAHCRSDRRNFADGIVASLCVFDGPLKLTGEVGNSTEGKVYPRDGLLAL